MIGLVADKANDGGLFGGAITTESIATPPQLVTVTMYVPVESTLIDAVEAPVDQLIIPPAFDITVSVAWSPSHISVVVELTEISGAEEGADTFIDSLMVPQSVVISTVTVPNAPLYHVLCVVAPSDHDHAVPQVAVSSTESPVQNNVSPSTQPIHTAAAVLISPTGIDECMMSFDT
jgi:hypothetical protein